MIRSLSQTTCGQHLVNYGYCYLPIITIAISYMDPLSKLLDQRFIKYRTMSWYLAETEQAVHGCYIPSGSRIQHPFRRACQNCSPCILLSFPRFQSPNHLLHKWVVWDLKPKSLGCRCSLYCMSGKVQWRLVFLLLLWSHCILHTMATVRLEEVVHVTALFKFIPT